MSAIYTTRIGHAHLKVRDLDRSIAFYTDSKTAITRWW